MAHENNQPCWDSARGAWSQASTMNGRDSTGSFDSRVLSGAACERTRSDAHWYHTVGPPHVDLVRDGSSTHPRPNFTAPALALLGFDDSFNTHCASGGAINVSRTGTINACALANFNVLSVEEQRYNLCRNLEWQACAARGLLPGQRGLGIVFSVAPNSLELPLYEDSGRDSPLPRHRPPPPAMAPMPVPSHLQVPSSPPASSPHCPSWGGMKQLHHGQWCSNIKDEATCRKSFVRSEKINGGAATRCEFIDGRCTKASQHSGCVPMPSSPVVPLLRPPPPSLPSKSPLPFPPPPPKLSPASSPLSEMPSSPPPPSPPPPPPVRRTFGVCGGLVPNYCSNCSYANDDIFFLEVCIFDQICENGADLWRVAVGERFDCVFSPDGFTTLMSILRQSPDTTRRQRTCRGETPGVIGRHRAAKLAAAAAKAAAVSARAEQRHNASRHRRHSRSHPPAAPAQPPLPASLSRACPPSSPPSSPSTPIQPPPPPVPFAPYSPTSSTVGPRGRLGGGRNRRNGASSGSAPTNHGSTAPKGGEGGAGADVTLAATIQKLSMAEAHRVLFSVAQSSAPVSKLVLNAIATT